MTKQWLVRLSTDSPELTDPDRISFEKDKQHLDTFFVKHEYNILCINIFITKSYQVVNQEIYVLGNDFFRQYKVFEKPPSDTENTEPPFLLEAFDKIVLGLHCIKDIIQQIGDYYYIYPHALRLRKLFELIEYEVRPTSQVCEGGTFLKGVPPIGSPFILVSHDLADPFNELHTTVLRFPPRIGMNINDTHVDTYFGIINFREQIEIDEGKNFNGILYILKETLEKIKRNAMKRNIWNKLCAEMVKFKYLVREYTPETPPQKIGINFKFDTENHTLLTNAFPDQERQFLKTLGIRVLAPEYSFGSNDYLSGGMNCSYILLPHNEYIQTNLVDWIIHQNATNCIKN